MRAAEDLSMRIGYNTNGLAHHSLPAAIELLAELDYDCVAITLDHAALNPYSPRHEAEVEEIRALLASHQLTSVIETGARYLLDPRQKHQPTLVSARHEGRPRRVEFLRHAVDIATALGSDCVSLWSGTVPEGVSRAEGMDHLVEGLHPVLEYASRQGMPLGFEPEPGMLVDTMDRFAELVSRTDSTYLKLTLDVGHLHCQGELPIAEVIHQWGDRLVNVHIEDMCAGVHEHLMFGEGEMDFPPILNALRAIEYEGPVNVELSRHSHAGPEAAQRAIAFLRGLSMN